MAFPSYWTSDGKDQGDGQFKAFVPLDSASEEFSAIQLLLDSTFDVKATAQKLKVNEIRRVENSAMWTAYDQSRAWLAQCRQDEDPPVHKVWRDDLPLTMGALSEAWQERVRTDCHETYLWHGTDMKSAEMIASTDFHIKGSKSRNGQKLGRGAYLGASASLADHYTIPTAGVHAILLVRASLGKVHITTKQQSAWSNKKAAISTTQLVKTGDWDSVCGDYRKVIGTYREYCVAYNHQLYPEYVIHYTREN